MIFKNSPKFTKNSPKLKTLNWIMAKNEKKKPQRIGPSERKVVSKFKVYTEFCLKMYTFANVRPIWKEK